MQRKDKDPHFLNRNHVFARNKRIELGTGQGDKVKKYTVKNGERIGCKIITTSHI
jgi:hypothetical protein